MWVCAAVTDAREAGKEDGAFLHTNEFVCTHALYYQWTFPAGRMVEMYDREMFCPIRREEKKYAFVFF